MVGPLEVPFGGDLRLSDAGSGCLVDEAMVPIVVAVVILAPMSSAVSPHALLSLSVLPLDQSYPMFKLGLSIRYWHPE